jgi:hypothetical protein
MYMTCFVIGASGSGKTSAVRELERAGRPDLKRLFFDAIGVPSEQEMIERWGSGEGWQRAMTVEWVKRMRGELPNSSVFCWTVKSVRRSSLRRARLMMLGPTR